MVAARISSTEITAQVTNRFVNNIYEAILINAPATTYTPGVTVDATFLSSELTYGTGGYKRQTIKYLSADVGAYADDGVGLARKAAIFTHDNSANVLSFSHIALCRGNGNVLTTNTPTVKPTAGTNGTYTNLPTVASSSGKGLTVNLTVTNAGASLSDWAVTVATPGYSYTAGETINIQAAALLAAGATPGGLGNLVFTIATVTTGGGQVVAVAKTDSQVSLANGNQAVFYFDLKQYGYYDAA